MTLAPRHFDNRLETLQGAVALSITLFAIVAQAQQTSTTGKTQSTTAKPALFPSPSRD